MMLARMFVRREAPRAHDEIVDLSAGPYRSKTNYTLLGRVIALRRMLAWLEVDRRAA